MSAEALSSRGPVLLAGALAALVLAVALLLLGRSAERGEVAEAYSSFRATPDGAKAAYLVLERLGFAVRRHTEALIALDGVDVLVVLEPRAAGGVGLFGPALFEDRETRAIQLFVRDGGCLVVASTIETPLHALYGVRLKGGGGSGTTFATPFGTFTVPSVGGTITALSLEGPDGETEPIPAAMTAAAVAVPALPSVLTAGVERAAPDRHPRELRIESTTLAAVPLLLREEPATATAAGRAAPLRFEAVAVQDGRGRAVFFADPSLFANRAILRADNALLLPAIAASHARGGAVAFDEMHHGFGEERGMTGYIGRRSLAPSLVQAAAAFLVLAIALGGRRGRSPITFEDRPPESIEHIRAMAEVYGKARLGGHVADRLHRGIVRDVEVATGVVVGDAGALTRAEEEALVEALRARGVRGFRSLETIGARRRRLAAVKDPRAISETDLLVLAREIGRFEADCRSALGQRFGEVRG